jgi:hypothetical protein
MIEEKVKRVPRMIHLAMNERECKSGRGPKHRMIGRIEAVELSTVIWMKITLNCVRNHMYGGLRGSPRVG